MNPNQPRSLITVSGNSFLFFIRRQRAGKDSFRAGG